MPPEAPTGAASAASGHELPRELIRFAGSVQCRAGNGALGWSLHGTSASPAARATELLFSGVTAGAALLPQRLHDARVLELEPHHFRVEAREGRFELHAHSVQRHCDDIARPFFGALPRRRVPRLTRWGWSLLLALLRVGPLGRLITRRGQ